MANRREILQAELNAARRALAHLLSVDDRATVQSYIADLEHQLAAHPVSSVAMLDRPDTGYQGLHVPDQQARSAPASRHFHLL